MHDEVELQELRLTWERSKEIKAGDAYASALESAGRLDEAATLFSELIERGYLGAYYQLAWLEVSRGHVELAQSLLERYLLMELEDDDFTNHVAGVLGHWQWHYENRVDAEQLLVRGADHYASARAALAKLLRVTDREDEAEVVLRAGVLAGEVECFLPLANLVDESGRSEEAERLYREGYALGDAYSAYNLHLLLQREYRNEEAAEWLWRAAEGGDELAINVLMDGLPQL